MLHKIPNLLTKIRHDGCMAGWAMLCVCCASDHFGIPFVCASVRTLNSILNNIQHENEIPISEFKDGWMDGERGGGQWEIPIKSHPYNK